MVLHVPFEEFCETAKRLVPSHEAYLTGHDKFTFVTAANPEKNILVMSRADLPYAETKDRLESAKFLTYSGRWAEPSNGGGQTDEGDELYVAAVAYRSRVAMPGLWMDVYSSMPTPQIVLRSMFDEFKENDEIGDVSYEEFLRLAHANVVILSPSEIETYLARRSDCP